MATFNFNPGSSSLERFYGWMNERHAMYLRRFVKLEPKPWTEDPIMQEYKFTNAYRELDRGTIALRKMERLHVETFWDSLQTKHIKDLDGSWRVDFLDFDLEAAGLIVFNTWWYRLFNLDIHAEKLGFVSDWEKLETYFMERHKKRQQIFTGAHMVRGEAGEIKVFPYLRLAKQIWERRHAIASEILEQKSLQKAFRLAMSYRLMGCFTSYELVCDWRFNLLTWAPDILTWGSVGPGAMRGMMRLGYLHSPETMVWLWDKAHEFLSEENKKNWMLAMNLQMLKESGDYVPWNSYAHPHVKPFEIREIEHSLCEFDKYERAISGEGRPRAKYAGKA